MDTTIRILNVEKGYGFAKINFSYSEPLAKFFHSSTFSIETEIDFNPVPDSVIIIPFVCNVLPIVWLTDSTLITEELDYDFYNSIEPIKEGYRNMYPSLHFKGAIQCKPTVIPSNTTNRTLCLFSGGVDACTTALRHKSENMSLISIWGSADYPLDNIHGWQRHEHNLREIADAFQKQLFILKSNFYTFIDNWGTLNELVRDSGESWWHGFQHGIGLISLTAPIAFTHSINTVYIASSFTKGEKATCASDPTIDNNLRFSGTKVFHDGYELTRQDKVAYIVRESNGIRIPMHVCLKQYQDSYNNCCRCEKCYRTILAILAEGGNPDNFGFAKELFSTKKIINDIKYKLNINYPQFYLAIQQAIDKNADIITDRELKNFAKYPNTKINSNLQKKIRRGIEQSKLHPLILKLLHKD